MHVKTALYNYGLKENQIAVFLACLEAGSGSIATISKRTGFARSTCEAILDNLLRKGFVSSFRKKRVLHYSAQDPRAIVAMAQSKAGGLEQVLPQLQAAYGQNRVQTTVRFFEGKEGVWAVLRELLTEATEFCTYGSVADLFSSLQDFPEFVKERLKRKIAVRAIIADSPKARERQTLSGQLLMKTLVIPPQYAQTNGMTFLWRNKIALFSLRTRPSAIIITSEELANMQISMFNALWDKYSIN